MSKLYGVLILCCVWLWALEVSGPETPLTIARGASTRQAVRLRNTAAAPAQVRVGYFLEKAPPSGADRSGQLLAGLKARPEITLAADAEQEYAWQVEAEAAVEPGDYLFWLVFSQDVYRQGSEAAEFVVQDAAYYPWPVRVVD